MRNPSHENKNVNPAYCRAVIQRLRQELPLNRMQVEKIKKRLCGDFGLSQIPRNSALIPYLEEIPLEERKKLLTLLKIRAVRSLSGINVVAVMTKPAPCPGQCIYCPGGIDWAGCDTPKSYTGKEPATMRGLQNEFDPFLQVKARINQLTAIGHTVDKIHLIIQGGTFLAQTRDYQDFYIQNCLDAITNNRSNNIQEAIIAAEYSKIRNVGITYETRPDFCREEHVDRMLALAGTWVEIGVQTLSDEIFSKVNRGHTLADVVSSFQIARDSGLKITAHMMPNLFVTPEEDLEMFRQLFEDPRFRPDALKIYPTLVLEDTILHDLWKQGEYTPYPEEQIVDMLASVKSELPSYVRIQRVQRDIPVYLIEDGVKHGNLREMIQKRLNETGRKCSCIRCREVGLKTRKLQEEVSIANLSLEIEKYSAADGIEYFLSFENKQQELLFGFLRLRIPSTNNHRSEIRKHKSALVRELHVYGTLVEVGKTPNTFDSQWQHRGLGSQLLEKAEKIAYEEYDAHQILVTSGIGVREYYRTRGYKLKGPYMCKKLV